MKKTLKFLFVAALLAAFFTSCEEDEDPVKPTAGFTISPTTVVAFDVVTFTNTSEDGKTYLWDFGDGSATSTEENPTHMFTEAGTYTVTLTATNADGNNETTQNIVVGAPNNYCAIAGSISYVDGEGDHVDGYVYDGSEMVIDTAYWYSSMGSSQIRMLVSDSKFDNPLLIKFIPNLGLGNLNQTYTYEAGAENAGTYDIGLTGSYAGMSFAWTIDTYGVGGEAWVTTAVNAVVTLVYEPTEGENIYDIVIENLGVAPGDYSSDWSTFLGSTNPSTVTINYRGTITPLAE